MKPHLNIMLAAMSAAMLALALAGCAAPRPTPARTPAPATDAPTFEDDRRAFYEAVDALGGVYFFDGRALGAGEAEVARPA